jgi:large subunit ribosomal protein L18
MKPKVKKVKLTARKKSQLRIRKRISGSDEKPRVSVYTSSKYTYAQVISDDTGKTLLSASTRDADVKGKISSVNKELMHNDAKSTKSCAAAVALGMVVAEKIKAKGIAKVVFDRNGFKYHGRVKALAEGIRAGGMNI